MSVVFQEPNNRRYFIFAKGAVERIIDLCTDVGFGDKQAPMTEEMKQEITRQMTAFADQGLVGSMMEVGGFVVANLGV